MNKTQALLNGITDRQLRTFAAEYARQNSDFANALSVRFAVPEFDAEVKKIAKLTESALEGTDDYRRRGNWGYIDFDLSRVDEEIAQRIKQGQYRLAFAQAAAAYTELLESYEYQEECEISDEAESFIDVMADISGKVKEPDDEAFIFERCIELADDDTASDYGGDYQDRFLQIAANFVTQQTRKSFNAAIARHGNGWHAGVFAAIKLLAIMRLDGETAAEAFIAENLQFDEIRKIAYDNAMTAKDFEKAAQLCMTAPENHNWQAPKWMHLLFDAYQAADKIQQMAEIAEMIVLSGDLGYYAKLKSLHKKLGDWTALYPEMLIKCKSRLSADNYMQILSKEKELALLLEQVQEHPRSIYQYGAQLAPKFPNEAQTLFLSKIGEEAAGAHNRNGYAAVCERIMVFRKAGYSERVDSLIAEYKQHYAKRPSFVDELRKIENPK